MKFRSISNDHRKLDLNWDHINVYVSRFKPGTPFDVEITRRSPKRIDPMRKYYFGAVLPPFMDSLGYDPEETELFHRQLKIVFFQVEPDKRGIYREKDMPSVFSDESTLPQERRVQFLEWVLRKAAENGAYIENPKGYE